MEYLHLVEIIVFVLLWATVVGVAFTWICQAICFRREADRLEKEKDREERS